MNKHNEWPLRKILDKIYTFFLMDTNKEKYISESGDSQPNNEHSYSGLSLSFTFHCRQKGTEHVWI